MAGRLLPWAPLTATVSMIIRAAGERLGFLGRLVGGLADMAWHLVTYPVLPVVVLDGATAKPALGRFASLFRDTWGENVRGIGASVCCWSCRVPCSSASAPPREARSLALVLGIAMLWFIAVVVTSALSGIHQTALYHYAAERAGRAAGVRGRRPRPRVPAEAPVRETGCGPFRPIT